MSSLLDDLDDLGSGDEAEDDELPVGPQMRPVSAGAAALGSDLASASTSASSSAAGAASSSSAAGEMANDLDDLGSDEDADEGDDEDEDNEDGVGAGSSSAANAAGVEEARDTELDAQLNALAASSAAGRTGLKAVARLRETKRFQDHLRKVEEAMAASPDGSSDGKGVDSIVGPLEEWPEYRLIVSSNAIVSAVDDEMVAIHRFLADNYSAKFPELASIVPAMLDYVKLVKIIRNETDLTVLDLSSVLTPAQVMVVTVTGSTTSGKPLTDAQLQTCIDAADEILALDASKQFILNFIESRMTLIAPNVSALVGTRVAAQLMGIAGGLSSLSRTPSCNVQVLGQKKKTLAGLSRASTMPHAGVIFESPTVASAPTSLKHKAAKVLAAKVVLVARVDAFRESAGGDMGRELRKQVDAKLAKWQEPPPARQKKPLKAPDDRPSRKRGGRRHRALKEKLGMTDVRRETNRVSMTGAGEYGDVSMGVDLGMLGTGIGVAGGKMRIQRKEQKILKKRKIAVGQGVGAQGGTLSTFSFTPLQGMELVNPDNAVRARAAAAAAGAAGGAAAGADSYFASTGTFSMIRR